MTSSPSTAAPGATTAAQPAAVILLASDDARRCARLTRLLSQTYAVEAVGDGWAALEAARTRLPDLVLADVVMPRLDGLGLLRELRADPRTCEVPVVMMSARAGEEARSAGMKAGADDYLSRPFSARRLMTHVRAQLNLNRARRDMTGALREHDEQLRSITDHVPAMIAYIDHDERYRFINRTGERWFDLPRTAIEGRRVAEILDAAAYARLQPHIQKALSGKRISFEHEIQRPDGSAGMFLTTHVPYRMADGPAPGFFSLSIDISESKRVEEALTTANGILNAVVEGTTDMVYVKDLAGRYVLLNPAGLRYLGRPAAEVYGKSDLQLFPADVARQIRAIDRRIVKSGQAQTLDESISFPGGTRLFQSVRAPQRDARGHIIGVIGVSRDVSEQRRRAELNRFLAEASDLLASSLDYETRLANIARLAVPQIADWCAVHMLAPDGSIEQLSLAHRDPAKLAWAAELQRRFPPRVDTPYGLPNVVRTGRPELLPEISDALIAAAGLDAEQLQLVRELGLKSSMIVPLSARGRVFGAITFVSTESGRHYDENDLAFAENLAGRAAIYIDNARLYRELQELNAGLERRVQERTSELAMTNRKLSSEMQERQRAEVLTRTLLRVSNKLNATLAVDTITDELAREAIALVGARSGFAGLRTAGGMSVRRFFNDGEAVPFEHTWPPGLGAPGWVLLHKEPYIADDISGDPVVRHELPVNTSARYLICTPILDAQGEVIGYFDIRDKKDGSAFTQSDQEMLMALAPIASIAIQNALAYQRISWAEAELKFSYGQLRALTAKLQSVREEEQTRIARELHDELGQALTALKFDLAWLAGRLGKMDPALRTKAQAITTQIDGTIKTVRRISTELRAGMLDDLGLAASIEWQAQDFQQRTGVHCEIGEMPQELTLTRAQATGLFRIFQEALTNVARHANATQVDIQLKLEQDTLILQVHDNGRGIPAGAQSGAHSLGLLGMRERAELLDGKFRIASAPGAGTQVTVEIPLQRTNLQAISSTD